jgi:glycosyltransferase involved in cell wall biosynthesis
MKILFIAPLPPPVTGHSIVSRVLLDELEHSHHAEVIDLSKESFKEGVDGFKRILQICKVLRDVFVKKKGVNVIYITIAESLAGNIKDLFIYLICFNKLSKLFIHLHGGTIKRQLWDRNAFLYTINKFFIRRMGGAIISGNSHLPIFANILPAEKIHIVPNFAQDYLFVNEKDISEKFSGNTLKILYMSNLIPKKGYSDLAHAFFAMPEDLKRRVRVDFAGAFESEEAKEAFLNKIRGEERITYHGIVGGDEKRSLFSAAHIFCLPTSYFEGQPISILEAYASGCVVMTTGQSGIYDIFEHEENGIEIIPHSPESIVNAVSKIVDDNDRMEKIAQHNLKIAIAKYRTHIYQTAIRKMLESSI